MRKLWNVFILLFIAILLTVSNAFAQEYITNETPKIDLTPQMTLTIEFRTGFGIPVGETDFSIYKVANLDENGQMTILDAYQSLGTDFNQLNRVEWENLPQTFVQFIDENQIEPTKSGKTDEWGMLVFDECEQGLYLVKGAAHVEGTTLYKPVSFFITLPSIVNDDWDVLYDVTVQVKYEYEDYDNLENIDVIKVWNDQGYENNRPEEITVALLRAPKGSDDYEEYEEAPLNVSNNWTVTWNDLNGAYDYQVKEINIGEEYEVDIKREANTFIITNTYKDSPLTLPETGGIGVTIIYAIGICFLLLSISLILHKKYGQK